MIGPKRYPETTKNRNSTTPGRITMLTADSDSAHQSASNELHITAAPQNQPEIQPPKPACQSTPAPRTRSSPPPPHRALNLTSSTPTNLTMARIVVSFVFHSGFIVLVITHYSPVSVFLQDLINSMSACCQGCPKNASQHMWYTNDCMYVHALDFLQFFVFPQKSPQKGFLL